MSRFRSFLIVSALLVLASGIAPASGVVKIKLDDTIQPISDEYIGRAIEQARQTNADAVLIELHTPGGRVRSCGRCRYRTNSVRAWTRQSPTWPMWPPTVSAGCWSPGSSCGKIGRASCREKVRI